MDETIENRLSAYLLAVLIVLTILMFFSGTAFITSLIIFSLPLLLFYFLKRDSKLYYFLLIFALVPIFIKFSILQAVVIGAYIVWFSWIAIYFINKNSSFARLFVFSLIFLSLLSTVFFVSEGMVSRSGTVEYLKNRVTIFFEEQKEIFRVSELDKVMIEENLKVLETIKQTSLIIVPSILMIICMSITFVNLILERMLMREENKEILNMQPFILWKMPWYFVWGFVFGFAGNLLYYDNIMYAETIQSLSLNIFTVFNFLFFIQGLSVAFFFFYKYDLKLMTKVALSIIALLLQMFFLGLTWIGVFDVWLNFRLSSKEV